MDPTPAETVGPVYGEAAAATREGGTAPTGLVRALRGAARKRPPTSNDSTPALTSSQRRIKAVRPSSPVPGSARSLPVAPQGTQTGHQQQHSENRQAGSGKDCRLGQGSRLAPCAR